MNLRHIETFVAIAEAGSFQAAAERLHLTQSAVSMQMKALEDTLQAVLFDRSSRPPTLSPLGRTLLDPARDLLRGADAFREIAAQRDELFGSLRLGVIPSATTGIAPSALAALREAHPRMRVRVEGGLSTALEDRVADGTLDAAIITQRARPPQGLEALTIMRERLIVAVHRDAPELPAVELLEALPFIRFNRATGVGRVIENGLQLLGVRVDESMELDSIEAILEMVSRRLGVAIVPEHSIADRMAASVRTLPFGDPVLERRVGLIIRSRNRDTALVRAVYETLREIAQEPVHAQR